MSRVRILVPLPCCVVKIDPHDENSRLASQTARKREISRDFSRFFVPAFFRKNTDPFCDFFRPQGSEPAKTGFSKKSETELNSRKDLNPRHGSNPFGFFVVFTECLQIVDYKINPSELGEDSNPQKRKICLLSVCFLDFPRLVWYGVWLQEDLTQYINQIIFITGTKTKKQYESFPIAQTLRKKFFADLLTSHAVTDIITAQA